MLDVPPSEKTDRVILDHFERAHRRVEKHRTSRQVRAFVKDRSRSKRTNATTLKNDVYKTFGLSTSELKSLYGASSVGDILKSARLEQSVIDRLRGGER